VLRQKDCYSNGRVKCWRHLRAVDEAFDEMLTRLSYQHATPASSLWGDALQALERFHRQRFYVCVSSMLERALRRGYLALAQRFIEPRDTSERCKYVAVAAMRDNVVFLRWLLASGTPIDKSSVIT
jgi:hypothetical protein